MENPTGRGDRRDVDIYVAAVRAAHWDGPDSTEEVPREFVSYAERGSAAYLHNACRKEFFPVKYDYERFLTSAGI